MPMFGRLGSNHPVARLAPLLLCGALACRGKPASAPLPSAPTEQQGSENSTARKAPVDISAASPGTDVTTDQNTVVDATSPADSRRLYTVEGQRFRLEFDDGRCRFLLVGDRPGVPPVKLDLTPPCGVFTWTSSPPYYNRKAESGGVPVGELGEPVAWRYRTAKGATVIAVIGDPVPEPLRSHPVSKKRREDGYHCAGSLQGLLFRRGKVTMTKKREQVGEFCTEVGMDEKSYWMLAHQ